MKKNIIITTQPNVGWSKTILPTKQLFGLAIIICIMLFASCSKARIDQSQLPGQLSTAANDINFNSTNVSLSAATKTALDFLKYKNNTTAITLKNAETVTKNGIPYMHIINANKGFVILAADSIYTPLLAYDSIGNFDKNTLNAGLAMWFNKHGHELEFVRKTQSKFADSIKAVNKALWCSFGNQVCNNYVSIDVVKPSPLVHTNGVYTGPPTGGQGHVEVLTGAGPFYIGTVGPLCATSWGQNSPWNQYCGYDGNSSPGYNGYKAAGCTPIAMAQIMYYWKYPTNNYDWPNLAVDLNSLTTQAQKSAQLIADIGHSQVGSDPFTNYGDPTSDGEGSPSDPGSAPYVFVSNFHYGSAQEERTIADQILTGAKNGTAYADLLTDEEYTYHRPCMLGGSPNIHTVAGLIYWPGGVGHDWVVDGSTQWMASLTFTTNYYDSYNNLIYSNLAYSQPYPVLRLLHMNWGRNGTNNGWFDASTDYTNSSLNDYYYFQTLIYNVHP